jgi:hypothetical protein
VRERESVCVCVHERDVSRLLHPLHTHLLLLLRSLGGCSSSSSGARGLQRLPCLLLLFLLLLAAWLQRDGVLAELFSAAAEPGEVIAGTKAFVIIVAPCTKKQTREERERDREWERERE